jgi:hypothetical protein
MGLLDDAIHEHMELKRLRGADPSEVAREEQDVLGPAHLDEHTELQESEEGSVGAEGVVPGGETADEDAARAEDESPIVEDGPLMSPEPVHEQDFANVGQETAELDMRTVLHGEQSAEEDLQREEPVEQVEDVLEETPDFLRDTPEQERLWFEQQPPRDFDFDK